MVPGNGFVEEEVFVGIIVIGRYVGDGNVKNSGAFSVCSSLDVFGAGGLFAKGFGTAYFEWCFGLQGKELVDI